MIDHKIVIYFFYLLEYYGCAALSSKHSLTTGTFSCSFAWPESASVSVTVLVDVGPVAMDLDPVFGVLAVVPVAVSVVDGLIAGARGIPLVESLGAPVLIGVAGAVLVVSIATSRMVGKRRLIRRLSLPL